jgi:uncharacterized protein (TIGR00369 family)
MTDTQVSGLDFVRGLADAEAPLRLGQLLGFRPVEVEEGRVVFELEPTEDVYNPIGSVHGGVIATLCDSALGCAVHTVLPAGVAYTTLEVKVNFLRKVTADTGVLRCEASVLSAGSRTATASCTVTDPAGRLVAHGTTTCLVMRP